MKSVIENKVLIIAGQPKSGTTSLFDWLSAHPEICKSTVKETRFFIDEDYPVPTPLIFDGCNLDQYLKYFTDANSSIFLEASPDYLYCQTPLKLKDILPNAKFVLIERDPVERMISTYRYYKQQGALPTDLSFDDYIFKQLSGDIEIQLKYPYRSLDQCRRSYITNFLSQYGDRCKLVRFEDLRSDPEKVLRDLCLFVGLSYASISSLNLSIKNQTRVSRSLRLVKAFRTLRRRLSYLTIKFPVLRSYLRPVSLGMQKALYGKKAKDSIDISPEVKALIYEVSRT